MQFGKIIAVAVLLALATFQAWAIEPVSGCQALEKWVSQLDKLPADYESFVALQSDQRRAVYARLTASQRAALWHRQLSEAMAQDGFSDVQRTLIAETRAFATAENIEAQILEFGPRHEAATAAAASLEARVLEAFPRAQAMQLFYDLGPAAAESFRSRLVIQCTCSLGDVGHCGPEGHCVPGDCAEYRPCGFTLAGTCDGLCSI